MRRKRFICVILMLLLAINGNVGLFAGHAKASEEEFITYDQYKANYYLDYSPYKYFMSSDFQLPAYSVVEENRNSPVYLGLITAWQVATFGGSDTTEILKRELGYYETFLFDILYTGYEPVNVTKEYSKIVKATEGSMLKSISKAIGDNAENIKEKKLDSLSEAEKNKLLQTIDESADLQGIFGSLANAAKILSYASDVEELIYKCCKIVALRNVADEKATVLEKVAYDTPDIEMQMACQELAGICKEQISESEIMGLLTNDLVLSGVADYTFGEVWDLLVDGVTGYGIPIKIGQSLGKWSSSLFFSTDKEIETFYEMAALCDFEKQIRSTVSYYANQYQSSRTVENARLYNAAVELFLNTLQLTCDISVKYAENNYDTGMVNLFLSYITGNHEKYEDYKRSLNNIKNEIKFTTDYANGALYNAYLDIYCIDVADSLGMEKALAPESPDPDISADVDLILDDLQENILKTTDLTLNEDKILEEDIETYGSMYIESGKIQLNGHKITVGGNLIQSGGTLELEGGTVDIGASCIIQT